MVQVHGDRGTGDGLQVGLEHGARCPSCLQGFQERQQPLKPEAEARGLDVTLIGDQAGVRLGPSAGSLPVWGNTPCACLTSWVSLGSLEPSPETWQQLFVCLPPWLCGLPLGCSDLTAGGRALGST